ncbi:MAG: glycosyltransferase family 2 protein [Nitrospina sp.]|nr:glycosyltransferase family 2 protein [Nitrospina sp.]MBT3855655.1 glycosyltransferase family 2 protein [Nitrospina sp.]MBT4104475.1 glycosyltransferase family 2 protein [Nitrospina sp.]MBT4390360.1 glycosyltransferase family 2 protein [Nitrospina sp.]MBT4622159.1 glycosyltransferase family 2 protein [Nitrospina sp.]
MESPAISVIMGNYNHAHYLDQSIPAILNQSLRPKELIIVDDGSTDNSVEIIEGFARKDPAIRFYKNEKNMGNVPTYMRAFAKVTGDYFHCASADDLILPGLFEKGTAMLAKYPQAGMFSGVSKRIDGNGNEQVTSPEPPYISEMPCYISPEKALELALDGVTWLCTQSAIWRMSSIREVGAYSPAFGNYIDEISAALITLNCGTCFTSEILGVSRVLENSFSDKYRFDPKSFIDLMEDSEAVMRSECSEKLPASFIDTFRKRSLYQMGAMALNDWKSSGDECHDYLDRALENPSLLDRIVLSASRALITTHKRFLKLFLYFRLRRLTGMMISKVVGRFKNK